MLFRSILVREFLAPLESPGPIAGSKPQLACLQHPAIEERPGLVFWIYLALRRNTRVLKDPNSPPTIIAALLPSKPIFTHGHPRHPSRAPQGTIFTCALCRDSPALRHPSHYPNQTKAFANQTPFANPPTSLCRYSSELPPALFLLF